MQRGIEDLKIYKLACRLELFIYKVTETFPADEKYLSVYQLRRLASSVTNNMSESYHRFSFGDKINRMYIARGEAGETRDGIVMAHRKGFVSEKITIFIDEKYTELLKGINAYLNYLRKEQENKLSPTQLIN